MKVLDNDTLNNRIDSFPFGPNNKNEPPEISPLHLKNFKLKLSAAEGRLLMQYLGLLIGDLVPEENKFWDVYTGSNEIVNLLLSKIYHKSCPGLIKNMIQDHLNLCREIFNKKFTPKEHFLVHYGHMMLLTGSPVHYWSMRGESMHRLGKRSAKATVSRRNLPRTLAIKHQLTQAYRFTNGIASDSKPSLGPTLPISCHDLPNYSEFSNSIPISFHLNSIQIVKWVHDMGLSFRPDDVLVVFDILGPSLSILKHVLVDNVNKQVCFIARKIDILCNNNHLQAFCVDAIEKDYITILMTDLHSVLPHHCNTKYYVVNSW